MHKVEQSRTNILKFLFVVLLLSSLGVISALALPKGSVWDNHLRDGLLFMEGAVSESPGYPMWGYSLLAGVFKENVIFIQLLLVLAVFRFWYRSLSIHFGAFAAPGNRGAAPIFRLPAATAIVLAPFLFLSTSYFSNSLAQLFAFCGTWIMYLAVKEEKSWRHHAAAGVLFGLGFHFRSELLILAIFLSVALSAYSLMEHKPLKNVAAFLAALTISVLPWVVYTSVTLDKPRLSSTNGGAAIYLGLGVLPGNPWKIVESDEYVKKLAAGMNLGSPWSADSDRYFSKKYIEAIVEHPKSYIKRIIVGWRYMMTQGVYLPKFRLFFASNDQEATIFHYADEKLRLALGLNAHEEQLAKMEAMGIDGSAVSVKHYLVLGLEYLSRLAYAGIFAAMLGWCIFLVIRDRMKNFASMIFVAYASFLLFGSGLMQTNPRHTTIALPVLMFVIFVLSQPSAGARRGPPRSPP